LKDKMPIVNKTPTEWKESGKQMVLRSFVAQKVFGVLHFGCTFSEAVLNMIPEVTVEENGPAAVEQRTWKHRYYVVSKPVKLVKVYLRQFRKRLRYLRQNYRYRKSNRGSLTPDLAEKIKARKKMSPRKRIPDQSWFGYFMSLPNKAINMLGVLAYENSKFNVGKDVLIVDKSPIHESHNSEERKRKTYEEDSDDSDEWNLNNLDDDYVSEEDPDFQPPSHSVTSESLEYTSDTDDLENSGSSDHSPDKPAAAPPTETATPSVGEEEKCTDAQQAEQHHNEELTKDNKDQSENTRTPGDSIPSTEENRKETSKAEQTETVTTDEPPRDQSKPEPAQNPASNDVTETEAREERVTERGEDRVTSGATDESMTSRDTDEDRMTSHTADDESVTSLSNGVQSEEGEDVKTEERQNDAQVPNNTSESTEVNGAQETKQPPSGNTTNQGKRRRKQGKAQSQKTNEVNGV
jgi:hypothetical protein